MTPEQVLEKAKERGYSINMMSADRSYYGMSSDRYSFGLELYPQKDEFVLTYYHGVLKLTTDKCGSFSNDKHFKKFEKLIREAVFDLL